MAANARVPFFQHPNTLKINVLAGTQKTKVLTATWDFMEARVPPWLPQVFQELREITKTAFKYWSEKLLPVVWTVLWSYVMFESWWNGAVLQRTVHVWVYVCSRTEHSCRSIWRLIPAHSLNVPSPRPHGEHPSEKEHEEDGLLRSPEWPLPGTKLPLWIQGDLWAMSLLFLKDQWH